MRSAGVGAGRGDEFCVGVALGHILWAGSSKQDPHPRIKYGAGSSPLPRTGEGTFFPRFRSRVER